MNKIVFMIDFAGTRTVLEDFKKKNEHKSLYNSFK